jgi:hypothetical protein
LAHQVTTGEDYHYTLNHLKKHHQSRVMPENNCTSVVDLIKERVVTSASARDNVDSQGTTGLLNIIDQNQISMHQKPPTSNHEAVGRGLLASRQLVFENTS